EPGGARFLDRLECLRPAVDADRDARAARLQLDERFAGRPVALHQPVGDVDYRLGIELAQKQREQRGAGRAVDVIIAEDGDAFARLDGIREAPGALVHVGEAARVGQEVAELGVAVPGEVVARDAAGEQELVDQRVHAEAVVRRPPPAPRLSGHGFFDVEGGGHDLTVPRRRPGSRLSFSGWAPAFAGVQGAGTQACPISRRRSVNQGTDTSNFLPPAIRSNSIALSSPPRSSSSPTTPDSPRSAASTA